MQKYDFKQSTFNHVIVEVEQALDDKYTYKSLTLDIDPEFNPTHHARIYGTVVAVPQGECYDEEGAEIEKEVQVGDKVYFHYLVTTDETRNIASNYYKVPYCWVFCVVRDGNILPVGSWTLCTPLVKEQFNTVEVDGVTVDATVSRSGLITGLDKKPAIDMATLSYVGKPLVGESPINANVGDTVILEKNSNFTNRIEGIDYYTVKQKYILGVKNSSVLK